MEDRGRRMEGEKRGEDREKRMEGREEEGGGRTPYLAATCTIL
jgi:hypothetical protein